MAEGERLPDDAVVVRCGLPPFRDSPLNRGCRHHPDGFFGFSVQASVGMTVEHLATACFNKSVGFTTVAKIRIMGYEANAAKIDLNRSGTRSCNRNVAAFHIGATYKMKTNNAFPA